MDKKHPSQGNFLGNRHSSMYIARKHQHGWNSQRTLLWQLSSRDRRNALGRGGPLGLQGFTVRLSGNGWKVVAVPTHRQIIWATRNFLKFQVMSLHHIGDQVMYLVSVMSAVASSLGASRASFRKAKGGMSAHHSPRTSQILHEWFLPTFKEIITILLKLFQKTAEMNYSQT